MANIIGDAPLSSWEELSSAVKRIRSIEHKPLPASKAEFLQTVSQGTAFLTFALGIDGVSIEIAKYARTLENLYQSYGDARLHFIASDFSPQADTILKAHWPRFQIDGINGWSKWDEGKWFDALFHEEMPAGSQRSSELAAEVYRQARVIAGKLGDYLVANKINLLITVNVTSNPGNLALTLALVLITEALGTVVINSNHDFYWDEGKPSAEREPGEEAGDRDHFFLNADNRPFFSLFEMLYPWQGRRWLQVNINKRQSERLIKEFGFPSQRVFELGTSVSNRLFDDYTSEDVKHARLRMANILSDGETGIYPYSLSEYERILEEWMDAQIPQVIGARNGLRLDLFADDVIYLLQPTRVIARKRIEKGVELIQALLRGPLRTTFEQNPERQLVLHVTGPTPLEHQEDLETILDVYRNLIDNLPPAFSERVFLAFSVGHETHASFDELFLEDMNITDIYRMATVVLFPSETEGRGLPIIESGAIGIPIICSRYQPEEVFADVIGENLPEELRIHYILFPEEEFSEEFLKEVADLLTYPETWTKWRKHNRQAIRLRYSNAALKASFQRLLDHSYEIAA
ncbi:MAG: glycosyltransferase [Gammaproteobacteria bacterium]|nr:glycosyltransferase [Gammaproteobacteria bacterium]